MPPLVLYFLAMWMHVLPQQITAESFEDRANILKDTILALEPDLSCKWSSYYASLYFSVGNTSFACDLVENLLDDWESKSGFCDYAMIAVYSRWHQNMPIHLKLGVRDHMLNRTLNIYTNTNEDTDLNTPNQYLMRATASYLSGQYWGHPNMKNASDYLNEWFANTTRRGMTEFDSTTYHAIYGVCLTTLQDFAWDKEIRQKASLTLDWLYLSTAHEWLKGWWISTTFRNYVLNDSPEASAAGALNAWLLFGNSLRVPNMDNTTGIGHIEIEYSLVSALSSYRVPPSAVSLASFGLRSTRSVRESHYACKSFADPNMWGWKWVYKTAFLTPTYGITSYATELGVKQAWLPHFCNQSTWLVRWPEKNPSLGSTLFIQQRMNCSSGNTSLEYTPNEQVLQHEGTMVSVYNIRDGNLLVEAWVPQGVIENVFGKETDWVFMQKGEVLVAMIFAEKLRWPDALHGYIRNGVKYDISTSFGKRNAAVVLTASVEEYGSLDNFIDAVENKVEVDFTQVQEKSSVKVTDLHGNTLFLEHDGPRQINGKDVDYTAWPLVESVDTLVGSGGVSKTPLLSQPAGSLVLQVTVPDQFPCVYNFENWTTTCRTYE